MNLYISKKEAKILLSVLDSFMTTASMQDAESGQSDVYADCIKVVDGFEKKLFKVINHRRAQKKRVF